MKFAFQVFQCLFLVQSLSAFSTSNLGRKKRSALMMSRDNEVSLQQNIRAFGVAASIFAFGFMTAPVPVSATPIEHSQDHVLSSSIQLAETIKTMDFSLPSSYDSISDAKASGSEQLVQEENAFTGTKVKKAPKAKSSQGEGFNLGGKQLTPEEREALAAERQAEREAAAAEKKAMEADKQAEKEAIAAAKRAEKEALEAQRAEDRAASAAEKAAKLKEEKEAKAKAEAAKAAKASQKAAESKFAGADFVDMGLPSYGDSTATKSKGTFSI